MSKSLNQAFIKAFTKEKAAAATRQAEAAAAAQKLADDFIVRFDTATCVIPTPHRPPTQQRQAEAVAVRDRGQRPAPAAATAAGTASLSPTVAAPAATLSAASSPTVPSPVAAEGGRQTPRSSRLNTSPGDMDDLRGSIAAQMLKAGIWEEQQIDAFIGGFPMISALHHPQAAAQAGGTGRPTPLASGSNQRRDPEPQSAPESEPRRVQPPLAPASQAERRHPKPQRSEPLRSEPQRSEPAPAALRTESRDEEAPRRGPTAAPPTSGPANGPSATTGSPTRAASPAAPSAPVSNPPTAHRYDLPTEAHVPPLAAPSSPALSSKNRADVEGIQDPTVASDPRMNNLSRSGEIFRLDRPSYNGPATGHRPQTDEDSGEQSSVLGSVSFAKPQMDISGARSRTPAGAGQAAQEQLRVVEKPRGGQNARGLEADLRRARMRIFNPVWEVDSFQWPDVCMELLEQRADSMGTVAQNLVSACQEGLQVLAITSPQSGEGRTTVACCLAKLAGSRGLNVAIVDGDIENPTLSYQTNLDVEHDWKTAIVNQLPLEEVAVHSIDDQVTLVPLVNPIAHNELSSDDNRIGYMLQELSESFDLVIVDMGHMGSTRSLVTSMSEQGIISAVVAVVDRRSSSPQQIEMCLRRIRQTGVASIGLIENFAA